MSGYLIKDTTVEERKKIVEESQGKKTAERERKICCGIRRYFRTDH